jgi:membrane-associated phospholipid phosphatase
LEHARRLAGILPDARLELIEAAAPAVALVAWSRVRLGDHTPAQTLAGAALGGLVATTVFMLLR